MFSISSVDCPLNNKVEVTHETMHSTSIPQSSETATRCTYTQLYKWPLPLAATPVGVVDEPSFPRRNHRV